MRSGSDPLLLIRELSGLGDVESTASMASVPPLLELDPERCYIAWDLILRTAASLDAIRDVFIFVEDCCELCIEPLQNPVVAEADLIAKALEEKRGELGGRRLKSQPPPNRSRAAT